MAFLLHNHRLKPLARELRRDQTECERQLWARLRRKQLRGVQFYRQRPLGEYIVDFYAPSVNLVVEVDGSQHLEEAAEARDSERTAYLQSVGLEVIRVGNEDVVENLDGVIERIAAFIAAAKRDLPL